MITFHVISRTPYKYFAVYVCTAVLVDKWQFAKDLTQASMTSTGGLGNNSYSVLRALFLTIFIHLTVLSHAQVIVDDCSKAPGRGAVGSLTTLSSNLIVDGESPRYKRGRNGIGYLSYITQHGFLQLEVTGFVFNSTSSNSWSLSVVMGSPPVGGNGTRRSVFSMTGKNVKKHTTDGGVGQWLEFKFEVKLRKYCPRRINIVLNGKANNDVTSGSDQFKCS